MTKFNKDATADVGGLEAVAVQVEASAAPQEVTLQEFCTRLSETVIRPELIGAFAHVERVAGNLRGTSAAYQSRYEAFINKPV